MWGPFNNAVGISQIDQHVTLRITSTNYLHFFEKQRSPLAVNLTALVELALYEHRTGLPTREGHFRFFLCESGPTFPSAHFWDSEVTGHSIDAWIIDHVSGQFGIGCQSAPNRRLFENQLGIIVRASTEEPDRRNDQ